MHTGTVMPPGQAYSGAAFVGFKPCRLLVYIVIPFRVQKINLSWIALANPNRSGTNLVHMQRSRGDIVYEILGAVSTRGKIRDSDNHGRTGFLSGRWHRFVNFPAADFHQLWPRHVNPLNHTKGVFKIFPFRVICSQKTLRSEGVKWWVMSFLYDVLLQHWT